jgi:ketosteroid isomerase-like protein
MVAVLLITFAQAQVKTRMTDKAAQELSQFESRWLIASLNGNKGIVNRIFSDDLIVTPFMRDAIDNRTNELSKMIDPALLPSEMKVRISGNIIVLTNSTSENDSRENSDSRNRSYHFLDTFNKRNGKWEIIATHFSPVAAPNNQNDEQAVISLENERSTAVVKKDIVSLKQLIADDFAGIEISGRTVDKLKFIKDLETGDNVVQSNMPEDMKVKVSGDMAVVTGRVRLSGVKSNEKYNTRFLFTAVWAKRNGQWQIINYQATSIS